MTYRKPSKEPPINQLDEIIACAFHDASGLSVRLNAILQVVDAELEQSFGISSETSADLIATIDGLKIACKRLIEADKGKRIPKK